MNKQGWKAFGMMIIFLVLFLGALELEKPLSYYFIGGFLLYITTVAAVAISKLSEDNHDRP